MNRTVVGLWAVLAVAVWTSGLLAQDAIDISREAGRALVEGTQIEGPEQWETSISLGTTLTTGNSRTLHSNARIASEKRHGKILASLLLEGAYGESEYRDDEESLKIKERTVANVRSAAMVRRRYEQFFLYGGGTLEHDEVAKVDYRTMLGLGLGTFLVHRDGLRISVEGGVGYLFEQVDGRAENYPTLRLAERVDLRLSQTAKLWQMAEYIPQSDEIDNFLISTEAGVEASINTRMSLGLVLKFRYDSTPPWGVEKGDFSLTAQVSARL